MSWEVSGVRALLTGRAGPGRVKSAAGARKFIWHRAATCAGRSVRNPEIAPPRWTPDASQRQGESEFAEPPVEA
jgi:hypothetical protein